MFIIYAAILYRILTKECEVKKYVDERKGYIFRRKRNSYRESQSFLRAVTHFRVLFVKNSIFVTPSLGA